mmetsp:Transcript_16253/g.49193  ORF Transcript_16253/g.49193 Transcript_16253/m.49193 type:complete len:277 (-) Transcript_16253:96-926(-)
MDRRGGRVAANCCAAGGRRGSVEEREVRPVGEARGTVTRRGRRPGPHDAALGRRGELQNGTGLRRGRRSRLGLVVGATGLRRPDPRRQSVRRHRVAPRAGTRRRLPGRRRRAPDRSAPPHRRRGELACRRRRDVVYRSLAAPSFSRSHGRRSEVRPRRCDARRLLSPDRRQGIGRHSGRRHGPSPPPACVSGGSRTRLRAPLRAIPPRRRRREHHAARRRRRSRALLRLRRRRARTRGLLRRRATQGPRPSPPRPAGVPRRPRHPRGAPRKGRRRR